MTGHGTKIYAKNGSKYSGGWKDNKKHGKGTYTFQSGSVLSGAFKDGIFNERIQDLWTGSGLV